MSEQNQRENRKDVKVEYMRGCEDTREMAYKTSNTFVSIIQERLTYILSHAATLGEAEEEIRKINELISEYLDQPEKVVDRELTEHDTKVFGKEVGIFTDGEEVISLLDFVDDEKDED